MRKRIISMILTVVLLSGTALAATYYNVVGVGDTRPVVINGEAMVFPDVEPMSYEGRTLLPLRAVAEALGIPIDYVDGEVVIDTIDLEALKDSCVEIYCTNETQWRQGSGVFIDYDEILTCYHVVDEAMDTYKIDDTYMASLGDISIGKDAAILNIKNTEIKPVMIGDSDEVKVGDKVYIISAPDGAGDTVISGEVLRFSNLISEEDTVPGFVVSAETKDGSSGGACFNSKGELIGIAKGGAEDWTGVIPINEIRQTLAA